MFCEILIFVGHFPQNSKHKDVAAISDISTQTKKVKNLQAFKDRWNMLMEHKWEPEVTLSESVIAICLLCASKEILL